MTQKLLLIDDDHSLVQALPAFIERRIPHCSVRAFQSATAGLDYLRRKKASAVITDVRMPEIDGLQVLEQVRVCRPEVPVVLMSGHGDRRLVEHVLARGAYDILLKPFDRNDLVHILELALGVHRLARKAKARQRILERLTAKEQALNELIQNMTGRPVALTNAVMCDRIIRSRHMMQRGLASFTSSLHRVEKSLDIFQAKRAISRCLFT